jgi:hypothetical protein
MDGSTCAGSVLVPATTYNKETYCNFIDLQNSFGDTIYSLALDTAFNLFQNTGTNGTGSCHGHRTDCKQKLFLIISDQVILFLTDGRPTDGSEQIIIDKIKEKNAEMGNRIVLLTFGLGSQLNCVRLHGH